MGHIKGGQSKATSEHALHIRHIRGVEMGQVEGGQTFAAEEHVAHVGDTGGVEMFESFDGGEIIKRSKPHCSAKEGSMTIFFISSIAQGAVSSKI